MRKYIAVAALSALVLAGCGSAQEDDNYVGVCLNSQDVRVDDSYCNPDGSSINGFFWGYFLATSVFPGHGERSSGYVKTYDTKRYNGYRGGVPAKKGTLTFSSYKPKSSTITNKDTSLSSSKWKTYDTKGNSSSGWTTKKDSTTTKKGSSGGGFGGGSKSKSGGFGGGGKRR